VTQFAYDFENRLNQISYPDGHVETYLYDYRGDLVRKTSVGTTTTSVYGTGAAPLAEKNETTGQYSDFLKVKGKTFEEITGVTSIFFHCDSLGTVVALSNTSGIVTDVYEEDPFGKALTENGMAVNTYQFVGGYGVREVSSNRNIMGVRIYDAALGRFLQADPIGFWGGSNFYRYVKNNPLKGVDPLGLQEDIDAFLLQALESGNANTIIDAIETVGPGIDDGLKDVILKLYQTTDTIEGGTAGYVRDEIVEGVKESGHLTKLILRKRQLSGLLCRLEGGAKNIAKWLYDDVNSAINEAYASGMRPLGTY